MRLLGVHRCHSARVEVRGQFGGFDLLAVGINLGLLSYCFYYWTIFLALAFYYFS